MNWRTHHRKTKILHKKQIDTRNFKPYRIQNIKFVIILTSLISFEYIQNSESIFYMIKYSIKMQTLEAIKTRRSVRSYSDTQKLTPEQIAEVVEY